MIQLPQEGTAQICLREVGSREKCACQHRSLKIRSAEIGLKQVSRN